MRWEVKTKVKQMKERDTGMRQEIYLNTVEGKNMKSSRHWMKANVGEEKKGS